MKLKFLFTLCLLSPLCGCGPRLSHTQQISLAVNEIVAIPFDAISREQTIYVKASSPGAPIQVHVYLQTHEAAIERSITLGTPPENLLASAIDVEQASLEAMVPPDQVVVVRLQLAGQEAANVQLEVTN